MELLQNREREIFKAIGKLDTKKLVIIGGYAVNAYTLPRFSIDCDIVVSHQADAHKIVQDLERMNYTQSTATEHFSYHGKFIRLEKELAPLFKVSMDIMFEEVSDRQTGAKFSASWIFENAQEQLLQGKTMTQKRKVLILSADALIVMKSISSRVTDIRDVFMLLPRARNVPWIQQEIEKRCDTQERLQRLKAKVMSSSFKDNLQGVYGYLDEITFAKHQMKVKEFCQ
ncbi:MAG: hypothetical protein QT02_C0006G0004 [archaeon GW2011_AR9]|nr:MAG: hypothetical protein QT02_C0006G0004 [archaeon GW2011_AR9]MBS3120479.1 hypothetical protein [Candidatus Woesearchaeota archaeon]HIG92651.1 hypothetical protein [Candidatus Woesearchaeota archaeon]HIH12290.1 hypothetical protein [Candidatus Woesearchaeota archaeon]